MDNIELFERLGLAIAIGAAVGVERHWREREERPGARTAGIRTFTMIGMMGGVAGLIDRSFAGGTAFSGLVVTGFLLALAAVMALFELREAAAEQSFSATTVIAAMLTFALGVLAILGDMTLASAGGAALVAILAAREFLHGAIRRLAWVELRSAVILLALTFVLLPIVPTEAIGPFGGISPRRILVVTIMLASISFAGYIAVKLLGPARGDLVSGAIGGVVSSTATTISFARRSGGGEAASRLAAGAIAAGAVSLLRTAVVVGTLAPSLLSSVLPAAGAAALVMTVYALALASRGETRSGETAPANPFELGSVLKYALLLVLVAFFARAAAAYFGNGGLFVVSGLSALADVDAATVTIAGMLPGLAADLAAAAIGLAILSNMLAKAVYASVLGSRAFSMHLWLATLGAGGAAVAAFLAMETLRG